MGILLFILISSRNRDHLYLQFNVEMGSIHSWSQQSNLDNAVNWKEKIDNLNT